MKRIDHFFNICELPKGSQSSADAAEPVAVIEEAESSGSAVVVASNKSNECDDEGGHEGGSLSGRKFQVHWKSKYNWIEYREHNDDKEDKECVFCAVCTKAVAMQMALPTSSREKDSYAAFVVNGFSNWKKTLDRFSTHERSELHKAAVSAPR